MTVAIIARSMLNHGMGIASSADTILSCDTQCIVLGPRGVGVTFEGRKIANSITHISQHYKSINYHYKQLNIRYLTY